MKRNLARFEQSLKDHHEWQYNYFLAILEKRLQAVNYWYEKGEIEKAMTLKKEADSMSFQFNKKECYINYGHCQKFDKPVSFIPGVCQIETQKCFIHRKDLASSV